jgi:hypothetical protein
MTTVKNADNTLGIDNLKNVVDFLGTTVTATLDADENKDGKVSLLEAARIAPSIMIRLFGAFAAFKNAGKEIKDLTPAEISELITVLAKALKVRKDVANELLQKWFEWAAQTVVLVDETAKYRKA